MKKTLCLLFVLVAFLVYTPSRPAGAQTSCWSGDWDADGTCAIYDCDDYDPTITITECKLSRQQYPVIYNPPESTCRGGVRVTRCFPNGYCYEEIYLQDCD
jgi:hypothetical protein